MCNELDPAEVERLVLNHLAAYQMLHRFANVKRGERIVFYLAMSGTGTSQLQHKKLAELVMYGTTRWEYGIVSDLDEMRTFA